MTDLTPRQRACYDTVRELSASGASPSIQEIRAALQTSTGNAHRLVLALKVRGYIDFSPRTARSIRVIEDHFSPEALERLSDCTLRRTAAHIGAILAQRAAEARA